MVIFVIITQHFLLFSLFVRHLFYILLYFCIILFFSNTNQEGENNIDQQYVPNPSIYAQVLETIETKYDSSFTSSAFIMLKQLQGILKQELKGKVWRPRSHGHWVYLMDILRKIGNLETKTQYSSYVISEEEKKRKRMVAKTEFSTVLRVKYIKRMKMEKDIDFLDRITSEDEMKKNEKKKIQLRNLQYVLGYLVGIFQENLSYNPKKDKNALHILLSCSSSDVSSYGGNLEDRVRILLDLVSFFVLLVIFCSRFFLYCIVSLCVVIHSEKIRISLFLICYANFYQ